METRSSAPLRTIVIGLGRIGFGYHCPEIARSPNFELVGVVDPLPERRSEAEALWRTRSADSLAPLLREVRPDLVVIASPTSLHAEHALAAFAHGAHVFCDKPVARSVAEFDPMLAAARAAGRSLVAYQKRRFLPEIRALGDLLARGVLGPVHLIRRHHSGYARRADWQAFRAHGGGLLNNFGSHCLDELLWLLGDDPVRDVHCRVRRIATAGDADDFVKCLLVTARGVLVDLEISQATALAGPPWEVLGAHGAARWDEEKQLWHVRHYLPAEAPPLAAQPGLAAAGRLYATEPLPWREFSVPGPADNPHDYYAALWRHLALGEPPPVTADDSRRLLELLERCHASAATEPLPTP